MNQPNQQNGHGDNTPAPWEKSPLTAARCHALSLAAEKESQRRGIDISFALADADGQLRLFRRFGNALPLSIILVPGKAYTAAITRMPTGELAPLAQEGGPLVGIHTADPRITLVAGGFPLHRHRHVVGALAVGGGTEEQDIAIATALVHWFEEKEEPDKLS